jgi:hypothetical protein
VASSHHAIASLIRSPAPADPRDSRINSNSTWLLPIRIRNALSIIGVSRNSDSTWRAASGGTAASTTVV